MPKGNQKYQRDAIEKEKAASQLKFNDFLGDLTGINYNEAPKPTKIAQRLGGGGNILDRHRNRFAGSAVPGNEKPDYNKSPVMEALRAKGDEERGYLTSGFRNFAETGGYTPEEIENLRASFGGALGGHSAAHDVVVPDYAHERGYLQNFADTGGYTDQDIQRIRAQAASGAPALFGALRDQYNLNRTRLGGNASAAAGFNFKNARQAAQQLNQDKLAANIGLAESQRAGKQYGIDGLIGTKTSTANLGLDRAGLIDNYNLGAADRTLNLEGSILDAVNSGKKYGLSSLQDLYGQDYAPLRNQQELWLRAVGATDASQQGHRGLNLQNDEVNRSRLGENIAGAIGAAAGGLTGVGAIMQGVNAVRGAAKK